MHYSYKIIHSPIGKLKLIASDKGLRAVLWPNENPKWLNVSDCKADEKHPVLVATSQQLQDYFQGKLKTFSLALDFIGTAFQKKVWQALLTIPYGETRSYAQIAKQIGHAKAVRAVGSANRHNPISIIAPCHRVIGSNGKLTGFAGGLEAKAYLLDLEAEKT